MRAPEASGESAVTIAYDTLANNADLETLGLALERDMQEFEERLTYRLTLRLGAMPVAAAGIVATLVKIL